MSDFPDLADLSPEVVEKVVIEGTLEEGGDWHWFAFLGTWQGEDAPSESGWHPTADAAVHSAVEQHRKMQGKE